MMSKIRENLKTPTVIQATYRIVTPMFIGDAEQNATGISPQSIKGALRFWWRALMWEEYLQEANQNEIKALQLLHEAEAKLFGIATDEKRETFNKDKAPEQRKANGQGAFLLSVQQPAISTLDNWPPKSANDGAGYLGYGLTGTTDTEQREAIVEGIDFTICLWANANNPYFEKYKNSLEKTLWVWSLFGGLGSRSRRGFGSITLVMLNNQNKLISNKSAYEAEIKSLLKHFSSTALAPYTTFSQDSKFRLFESGKDARDILKTAGKQYKEFRSELKKKGLTKDRISFGLPLPNVADEENLRRASPLLFHVHALAGNQYITSALYLPTSIFHKKVNYQSISTSKVADFVMGKSV